MNSIYNDVSIYICINGTLAIMELIGYVYLVEIIIANEFEMV